MGATPVATQAAAAKAAANAPARDVDRDEAAPTFPMLLADDDAWLVDAACADLPIESFFVQAGHVIDEEVLNVCRACPVRLDCLRHAYNPVLNITGGYFGGMSPGMRRELTFEQAVAFCATDRPTVAGIDPAADEPEPVIYS